MLDILLSWKLFTQWVLGLIFLLGGLSNLFSEENQTIEDTFAYLLMSIIGLTLIPPIRNRIKSKYNSSKSDKDEWVPEKYCRSCNSPEEEEIGYEIYECENCKNDNCWQCWDFRVKKYAESVGSENHRFNLAIDKISEVGIVGGGSVACFECVKEVYIQPIIKLLESESKKFSISDIAAIIRQDRDSVEEILKWMYEIRQIDFAGNGRYFIHDTNNKSSVNDETDNQNFDSDMKQEDINPEKELESLKGMLDKGLINQEDYDAKKKELLGL